MCPLAPVPPLSPASSSEEQGTAGSSQAAPGTKILHGEAPSGCHFPPALASRQECRPAGTVLLDNKHLPLSPDCHGVRWGDQNKGIHLPAELDRWKNPGIKQTPQMFHHQPGKVFHLTAQGYLWKSLNSFCFFPASPFLRLFSPLGHWSCSRSGSFCQRKMILLLPGAPPKPEVPVRTSYPTPAGKGDAVRAPAAWAWQDGHPGERKTNFPN